MVIVAWTDNSSWLLDTTMEDTGANLAQQSGTGARIDAPAMTELAYLTGAALAA